MSELPVTSPTLRFTIWGLLLLFSSIVVGSYFAKTEIVARGTGRVLALGRTQTIQPQFEGKIAEIIASDGMAVKTGDQLVKLDSTQTEADVARISANVDQAKRQLAVHEAILQALDEQDPTSPDFLAKGRSALNVKLNGLEPTARDIGLIEDSLKSFTTNVAEFDAQAAQLQASINTADTKVAKSIQDHDLLQERALKSGGLATLAFLDLKKEMAAADQDYKIALNQKTELEAQRKTTLASRARYIATVRADQQQKANDLRTSLATGSADLETAKSRLRNTSIVSPVSGHIENLQVFTQGGYVQAGQTLMSVVPDGEGLEIEALFENRDAGFLAAGQTVFIKLDAYPAERFGILKGTVSSVGADARKDDTTKNWVYAARIKPDQVFVEREGKRYPIVPGMTGTTDVVTGDRRLISYFFEPIIKAMQDGFGER